MIGRSLWQWVFIRICIVFLQYVVPLGAFVSVALLFSSAIQPKIPIVIAVWAVAETLFFLLVFSPRYFILQRDALHPAPPNQYERQKLFQLCLDSVSDPEHYLTMWFKGASLSEICREDLKQFFCWSFLNKEKHGLLDDSELEDYVNQFEKKLGKDLMPGKGNATSLRLTLDPVRMLPRPLMWYLVSRGQSNHLLAFHVELTDSARSSSQSTDSPMSICYFTRFDSIGCQSSNF